MDKCYYCNHKDICKHKDKYQEVLSKIVLNVPDPFSLVLNCKYYYDTTAYLRGTYYNDCSNSTANGAATYNLQNGLETTYE